MPNDVTDGVILVARLLLAALFLIFGWRKLVDFSGTVSRMVQDGAPTPVLSAVIAIFMELPVAFAVAVGAFTRPAAALLALYTLGTALIAHHYWTVTGANKVENMESFYKNLSIMGGFLLLCITGAGKYSIDDEVDAALASKLHAFVACAGPAIAGEDKDVKTNLEQSNHSDPEAVGAHFLISGPVRCPRRPQIELCSSRRFGYIQPGSDNSKLVGAANGPVSLPSHFDNNCCLCRRWRVVPAGAS